ncbi:MAG: AMP-binding protein [Dehalococcoidia bacterium]|nr:AMP-binding protein [Dehalococcoidia bacterium]MDD5493089.1 AMP-binding protein [Dehalococcoidia bacterium]
MTIPEMLARNARLYPSDPALIELRPGKNYRREVTWKEFDDEANRVANALLDLGIKRNDKVIHWMMNSIDWLVVYFGILRTGAWIVPLNFRFTSDDLKYCADVSEATLIILGEEFIERVDAAKSKIPNVEKYIVNISNAPGYMSNLRDLINRRSCVQPGVNFNGGDSCSLYFTSGTTGVPKPILLTHDNLKCAAITEYAHHHQTKQDNFILIPPLYHTGSKMHWFGSLIVGGRATLLNEVNPENVIKAVHSERGTIVWLLVPWAHDVLMAIENGEIQLSDYDLSCWRLMHIGAQPVPPALVKRWKKYFPSMQYDTNYGLSESTGPGCVHLGIENERKVGAIGVPGFNWEIKIVDDKGNNLPCGQIGELLVKGDGVMKEYYKNPEKTAETIRKGWLYTGDMATMDEEGFIYLVDRKKDVIITGGENIYPVEVEDALHNYDKIYDVAVIGIPDERLGEIALAVVDPKPGIQITEEEILEFCKQNLARHKVPRKVIFDKIPRNPTGKIEKPKLRAKYKQ